MAVIEPSFLTKVWFPFRIRMIDANVEATVKERPFQGRVRAQKFTPFRACGRFPFARARNPKGYSLEPARNPIAALKAPLFHGMALLKADSYLALSRFHKIPRRPCTSASL